MLPGLFVLLIVAQEPTHDRPPPVAVVLEAVGNPTRTDGDGSKVIRRLDLLRVGDKVAAVPGGGSVTILFVSDGHREKLHEGASIVVKEAGGEPKGRVDRLASTLSKPNLDALRDRIKGGKIGGGVFRAGEAPRPAVAPLDGAAIATTRPTLRWPSVEGAEGYRVEVLAYSSVGGEKILSSRVVRSTESPHPADSPPLDRMRKYRWRVASVMPGRGETPIVKESRFTVGPAELEAQAASLAALARQGDSADRLLAAVTFESLALLDELYPLYSTLAAEARTDANLWAKTAEYAARAGLPKEAEAARKKAEEMGWKLPESP